MAYPDSGFIDNTLVPKLKFHRLLRLIEERYYSARFHRSILLLSPPRTGSTIVFNALRCAMPGKSILKTHENHDFLRQLPLVLTYRHPCDALASAVRLSKMPSREEAILELCRYMLRSDAWRSVQHKVSSASKNCGVLRYEDFYADFGHIFSTIEHVFGVRPSKSVVDTFNKTFNVMNVYEISQQRGSFEFYNSSDQIHGQHVSVDMGRPNSYRNFFDASEMEIVKNFLTPLIGGLGYIIEDSTKVD
ncbi:hypothetical protein [Acuticoccus yangtzensis]|nr:hypothetical protein [Acuticoccus yangtzensis]